MLHELEGITNRPSFFNISNPDWVPTSRDMHNLGQALQRAQTEAIIRASKVLERIELIGPPPTGVSGGAVFYNREGQLPTQSPRGANVT